MWRSRLNVLSSSSFCSRCEEDDCVRKHSNDGLTRIVGVPVGTEPLVSSGWNSSAVANSMAAHMVLCVFGSYHTANIPYSNWRVGNTGLVRRDTITCENFL